MAAAKTSHEPDSRTRARPKASRHHVDELLDEALGETFPASDAVCVDIEPLQREGHTAQKRVILEVGTGNDWHGGDYTKAAIRAVEDAIRHCSLTFLSSLDLDPSLMLVDVTIGVQRPEQVDHARVKAVLPHGEIRVSVVPGGLDVPNQGSDDLTVIANAAIAVSVDIRPTSNG